MPSLLRVILIDNLARQFRLKQLVKFPTRCANTLDLILTNIPQFYNTPQKLPPFGLSDHFTVALEPLNRPKQRKTTSRITVRRKNPSSVCKLGTFLNSINWDRLMQDHPTSEQKLQAFSDTVKYGLDNFMPQKSIRVCNQEPPWMTIHLKNLITKRQKALADGKESLFKMYRNRVNRERKLIRRSFYQEKVQHAKSKDPKKWWKQAKQICGMQKSSTSLPNPDNLTLEQLADKINDKFVAVMQNYSPIMGSDLRIPLHNDQPIQVQPSAVYSKLSTLQTSKASGPDDISPWLLKEYAAVLAHPISSIINCSFKNEMVPANWKKANVVPIPKSKPVKDFNKDLRPISLTPVISKVAEEFVIERELKPAIKSVIDINQYGGIDKSSATP